MANLYEMKGLEKVFRVGAGSFHALKGIDLNIEEGRFIAFQGTSGSGKSTLLNLLGLIDRPSKGSLDFEGKNISTYSEELLTQTRREKIGFVFQAFNLVPVLTALENVEYPLLILGLDKKEARERALKALEKVGLLKVVLHRPFQLSGGQKQRVAIARAIVKSPKVIIADEPTANLDSKNAQEVFTLLDTLRKDLSPTILLATHDEKFASRADKILHLGDGLLLGH